MLGKQCVGIKGWSFVSGIMRLGYRDRKRRAAEFNCVRQPLTWRRSGHVVVREAKKADARNFGDEAWWAFFRAHIDVSTSAFIEKTPQRTKHVLHMFCEHTVINIRHVACQWRGTAFSRRRPLPARTAACSRTLPLASDAVALLFACGHWAHTVLCRGHWNHQPSGTPRKWVACEHSPPFGTPEHRLVWYFWPSWSCTNRPARKKQPSCTWPERPARFVFSDVFGFRAFFGRGGSGGGRERWERRGGKECVFVLFSCVSLCVCLFFFCIWIFVRARLCIYVCICGCKCVCGLVRFVNPGDATPIVQSRPARQSYKQSQTDIRRNITQNRNPVDFSFHSWVGPAQSCAQVGSAQHILLEIQDGIRCDNPCVRMVNRTPLQLGGSAKRCNPCTVCTWQNQKRSLSCCNRTNATRFSVQRVNISVRVWLKKYRGEKRPIGQAWSIAMLSFASPKMARSCICFWKK